MHAEKRPRNYVEIRQLAQGENRGGMNGGTSEFKIQYNFLKDTASFLLESR